MAFEEGHDVGSALPTAYYISARQVVVYGGAVGELDYHAQLAAINVHSDLVILFCSRTQYKAIESVHVRFVKKQKGIRVWP
ncbi:MAG TPA: hypothetical protein VK435_05555 [Thermodesulfovibrionales bacterium]|nr:hypothetical protein [Thermodesulfovibrionales bacterium]